MIYLNHRRFRVGKLPRYDSVDKLYRAVKQTIDRGGNVIIRTFAL